MYFEPTAPHKPDPPTKNGESLVNNITPACPCGMHMTSSNVTILTKIKHIHCAYYVHYTGGQRMLVANALAIKDPSSEWQRWQWTTVYPTAKINIVHGNYG